MGRGKEMVKGLIPQRKEKILDKKVFRANGNCSIRKKYSISFCFTTKLFKRRILVLKRNATENVSCEHSKIFNLFSRVTNILETATHFLCLDGLYDHIKLNSITDTLNKWHPFF